MSHDLNKENNLAQSCKAVTPEPKDFWTAVKSKHAELKKMGLRRNDGVSILEQKVSSFAQSLEATQDSPRLGQDNKTPSRPNGRPGV